MLMLEALRAELGDCLLLHWGSATRPRLAVIDGGPSQAYASALRPRLERLRRSRRLPSDKPLDVDLMMVSRGDAEHVGGFLELLGELDDSRSDGEPEPWRIRRFWHNAFDLVIDQRDVQIEPGGGSGFATATGFDRVAGLLSSEAARSLAFLEQDRALLRLLGSLGLSRNRPFLGLVSAGAGPISIGGLDLTVIAPEIRDLTEVEVEWSSRVRPLLQSGRLGEEELAIVARFLELAAKNLRGLVVLAEAEGRRFLLSGDDQGDRTLRGLARLGFFDADGRVRVDVLKVPRHSDERAVDVDFFRRIRARHLVLSTGGGNDEPGLATLQKISKARLDDEFTIHLTDPLDELQEKRAGKEIDRFFVAERRSGRKYEVETRPSGELALKVSVA